MVTVFKYFEVCFLQRLNVILCTLVNTNINLQIAYDVLEFEENMFSKASRAKRHNYSLFKYL